MYAMGDLVVLPSGRGIGIVLGSDGEECDVFLGREGFGNAPKVEKFCECEVQGTRRNSRHVAKAIIAEIQATALRTSRKADLSARILQHRERRQTA